MNFYDEVKVVSVDQIEASKGGMVATFTAVKGGSYRVTLSAGGHGFGVEVDFEHCRVAGNVLLLDGEEQSSIPLDDALKAALASLIAPEP
jgi:hypothetical protein